MSIVPAGLFSGLTTMNTTNLITICGAIVLLFCFLIISIQSDKIRRMQKFLPLIEVFAEASKGTGKPVGVLVDKSGKMVPFVCEPNVKNPGLLDKEKYTIINPDLVKPSARSRFVGSPDVMFYPMPGFLPFGFHESAALVQVAKKIRENSLLNWLPSELSVIVLTFDETGDLLEDCKTMIADAIKFKANVPDYYTDESFEEIEDFEEISDEQLEFMAKQLMSVILNFRKEINVTPVKCEPVYLSEAAELCSVGVTGKDVSSLLSLQEQGDRAEQRDWIDKHKDLIIIVAGIVMIPVIYMLVMKFTGGS